MDAYPVIPMLAVLAVVMGAVTLELVVRHRRADERDGVPTRFRRPHKRAIEREHASPAG